MNNVFKYISAIIASVVVIYFSLDFKNLEKYKEGLAPVGFNANEYAQTFWNDSLPLCIQNATALTGLLKLLKDNPENACKEYGRKLGISKTYYFMSKGKGIIEEVENEYILVQLEDGEKVKIAVDFVFGNAVRDGSGKVNIDDFLNMTDFNLVSVSINKLVKEKVVAELKESSEIGKSLEFAGAFEVSEANIDLSAITLIPVSVKLSNG